MPIPAGVAVFARARLFASSSYNVKRSGTTFPKCVRVMFAGSPTDQDFESAESSFFPIELLIRLKLLNAGNLSTY